MRSIDTTTCLGLSKNNMKNYTYIVNHWSIDMTSGFITHQITQEQKRLGKYQLKLVSALLEHTDEVLSREQLTQRVWQHRVIGNNSLPNAIHTLRVALGDKNKQRRIIQTIPKMGYRIDPCFCNIIAIAESTETKLVKSRAPVVNEQTVSIISGQTADSSENEQAAMTVETGHHSRVSIPNAIMPTQGIFSNKRLSACLLLAIMVIFGLNYLILQQNDGSKHHTIEQNTYDYMSSFQPTVSNDNLSLASERSTAE